uniref:SH2 domain-containing protein n=1 Tax=Steinernema glaseri TaxID=37863 RepID=A0A1I8APS1_9BILA
MQSERSTTELYPRSQQYSSSGEDGVPTRCVTANFESKQVGRGNTHIIMNQEGWLNDSGSIPPGRIPNAKDIFNISTRDQLQSFLRDRIAYAAEKNCALTVPPVHQMNLPEAKKYEVANDARDDGDKYEMEFINGNVMLNISKDWNPPELKEDHYRTASSSQENLVHSILKKKKDAPVDAEWTRNSDSWERRRAASVTAQDAAVVFERKLSGTQSLSLKLTHLNNFAIFKKYEVDELFLRVCEDRMRVWIRNSVIKPLHDEITAFNDLITREKITPHIKVGHTSLEHLQQALNSYHALHSTVLPYLMPYLRAIPNQEYLVSRVKQLASDIAMREFKWQSGSNAPTTSDGKTTAWNEQLPTDSELVWQLFCVFMDTQMTPQSLAIMEADIQKPFTNSYTHSKTVRITPIQKYPHAFYISMASSSPPHFELYTDGGRTVIEYGKGSCNLFKILVLFFRHAQLYNNDCIDQIHLGSGSLNVSRIFASYL